MPAGAIEKTTLSDRVTRALRDSIVSGDLPAGSPLKQEELASRFGISMGALREALRTLHSDGLVTIFPNRGALVSDLAANEAEEIFDIRTFLELGALELALPRLTDKELTAAAKICDRMDNPRDAARWAEMNRELHETIYAPAGRPKLLALIRNLHDNVSRYMRLYLDTLNFQEKSQNEHRALIEACRAGDSPAARELLRSHLTKAREQLVHYLNGRDN